MMAFFSRLSHTSSKWTTIEFHNKFRSSLYIRQFNRHEFLWHGDVSFFFLSFFFRCLVEIFFPFRFANIILLAELFDNVNISCNNNHNDKMTFATHSSTHTTYTQSETGYIVFHIHVLFFFAANLLVALWKMTLWVALHLCVSFFVSIHFYFYVEVAGPRRRRFHAHLLKRLKIWALRHSGLMYDSFYDALCACFFSFFFACSVLQINWSIWI